MLRREHPHCIRLKMGFTKRKYKPKMIAAKKFRINYGEVRLIQAS
jgi:hypothetical protein